MKKTFLVFVMAVLAGVGAYAQADLSQNPQWDFFKNFIPKQKTITISDSGWEMIIDDKYKVSFSGTYRYSGDTGTSTGWGGTQSRTDRNESNATFRGTGFVVWDTDKMKINMTTNASGDYNYSGYSESWYGPIGSQKKVSSNFNKYASGNTTINSTFDLLAEITNGNFSGRLNLNRNRLTLNMSGNTTHEASISIGGSWYKTSVIRKTESELNTSSKDAFGEWRWNEDRTKIFLKSQMSDNKFVIWNRDGSISWSMEMGINTKGVAESTTETKDRLINLSMSFDGTPSQVFAFIENKEAKPPQNFIQLDYGVYNRFLGTLDKKSDVILNQIKDKSMLILQFKDGNTNKTDMFLLEGLDTILDYLQQ